MVFLALMHLPRQLLRVRPYLENYIVDASIWSDLFQTKNIISVSSFKEHTVDALAIGAEEGRSNLR
jgi:hypothetical protein